MGFPIPNLASLPGASRPGGGGTPVPPGPPLLAQVNNVYSMEFDSLSDQYIDLGDSDNLSFGNNSTDSSFSLSGWVKPDSTTKFKILGKYDSSNTNYEYQFGTSSSRNLALTLYSQNTADRIQRYYNNPLTSLDWQHWVATYDGSGNPDNIKIYINGVQVGDTSVTVGTYTAMQNTAAPLLIASESVNYANGKIDEVAIFNVELTEQEVQSIYNATETGKTADLNDLTTPPVKWYRMGD